MTFCVLIVGQWRIMRYSYYTFIIILYSKRARIQKRLRACIKIRGQYLCCFMGMYRK